MNSMYNKPKQRLSIASIISMIGATLFAIAAAFMVLLPAVSVSPSVGENTSNTFKASLLDEQNKDAMKFLDEKASQIQAAKALLGGQDQVKNGVSTKEMISTMEFEIVATRIYLITATIVFIGIIAVAAMVVLGKALQFTAGGRSLANIFSILGFVMSVFYLVWSIVLYSTTNKLNEMSMKAVGGSVDKLSKVGVGIGPILMAIFATVAMVFCLIASSRKSAMRTVNTPVNNSYNPNVNYGGMNGYGQMGAAPSPVMPDQMNYVGSDSFAPPVQQPVPQPIAQPMIQPAPQPIPQPVIQPDPQPIPQPAPQPIPQEQVDDDPPTVAQIGAIEGIKGDYESSVINMKPGEKIIIGRDPTCCNIVISSEKRDISRSHCSVKYDPYTDSFKVIDMSSNGTFVNGQRLPKDQETQLPAGTVLALGSGENQFRLRKM